MLNRFFSYQISRKEIMYAKLQFFACHCHLLITLENSLDRDKAQQQNIGYPQHMFSSRSKKNITIFGFKIVFILGLLPIINGHAKCSDV